jgi:hypothetical protein
MSEEDGLEYIYRLDYGERYAVWNGNTMRAAGLAIDTVGLCGRRHVCVHR